MRFETSKKDFEQGDQLNLKVWSPRNDAVVGKRNGKYFLVDFTKRLVQRVTLGAYAHLAEVWAAETNALQQVYGKIVDPDSRDILWNTVA